MTDSSTPLQPPVRSSDLSGTALLQLARRSRNAARERVRSLSLEDQLDRVLDVRPESRMELLMLSDHPERIVSRMPETEFCVTARATGMSEAPWLLSMANPEQTQACFDLDCWRGSDLERERLLEWLSALAEGGQETLVQAIESVDLELLVLAVASMSEVVVMSKEDTPPDGWFTLDGVVYFGVYEHADPALLRAIALAAFHESQEQYWRIVYGVLFESQTECEEFALRWRTGRLADLGFPELEEAMRAYRPLQPEEAPRWELGPPSVAVVPVERLPKQVSGTLLEEGLSKLSPRRASDILGYVLAVANALAIADRLPISASESMPESLEKALRGIDLGLRELSRSRGDSPEQVLDRTRPLDLFRIGATLDPGLRATRLGARDPESGRTV